MLMKQYAGALLLGMLCLNTCTLDATKPKKPAMYVVSPEQVDKFFQENSFDFQARLSDFQNGDYDLDTFTTIIKETVDGALQRAKIRKGTQISAALRKIFGSSQQPKKWINQQLDFVLKNQNEQRRKGARQDKSPYVALKLMDSLGVVANESEISEAISAGIAVFLNNQQNIDTVPEFWLLINQIQLADASQLIVHCLIAPAQSRSVFLDQDAEKNFEADRLDSYDNESEDDEFEGEVPARHDFDNGDDFWNTIGQDLDWKSNAAVFAVGILAVAYGIYADMHC